MLEHEELGCWRKAPVEGGSFFHGSSRGAPRAMTNGAATAVCDVPAPDLPLMQKAPERRKDNGSPHKPLKESAVDNAKPATSFLTSCISLWAQLSHPGTWGIPIKGPIQTRFRDDYKYKAGAVFHPCFAIHKEDRFSQAFLFCICSVLTGWAWTAHGGELRRDPRDAFSASLSQ